MAESSIRGLLREDPVRYMGTPGMERMAGVLEARLSELGFHVRRDSVPYAGWHPLDAPRLQIVSANTEMEIEAKTMIYSPPVQAEGHLEYAGRRMLIGVFDWCHFDLVQNGEVAARLIATDEGPAIPLSLEGPEADVPSFIIGRKDGDHLKELVASGGEQVAARISSDSQLLPEREFANIIGTLCAGGGEEAGREVLLCAHYDTIYESPGANDNGSGLLCAEMVAEQLAKSPPDDVTVTVAFFGGEELLQLGSRAYLRERLDRGSAHSIDLVVNLDMVGVGDDFWPWVDDATEPALRQVLENNPCPHPVEVRNPPLTGDHYPFYEEGIPSTCLIWWLDENYHLPGDTYGLLDEEKMQYTAGVCLDFIREFLRQDGC